MSTGSETTAASRADDVAAIDPRVERALAEHPEVADSAVAGLPDDRWGEAVTAFVVRRPGSGLTEETLLDFCRARLAGYKCPRTIRFVDQIPRNPAGKPLRRVLKQRFAEDRVRRDR